MILPIKHKVDRELARHQKQTQINKDNIQKNIKYGKLPVKEPGKKPRNKLSVDIISSYLIQINKQKENLNLKDVTMIDSVTGWFEVTQYNDKRAMEIANLVETTLLSRYPIPMDITYDQGK